ncbi:MAG: hypothetical protein AB8G11_06195 [Saprospiraceae bacterium]
MQIANPIYDVVFKYMMKDKKVAKLFLSAIIDEEIVELQFEPTEAEVPIKESIIVLRMDFKATIRQADGSHKVIIIEIQKAKLHTDIMRFRRYLGQQYSDADNSIKVVSKNGEIEKKEAIPLLSIYFLGHKLNKASEIPVIKVERKYIDVATGEIIKAKEKFIESLTHDSFIIQIPNIKEPRRTELEKLLYIFDQNNIDKSQGNHHLLDVKEEDLPENYRPIIRRLLHAFANPKVRETMTAEDEIIEELQGYERKIEGLEEKLEQERKDKEQGIIQLLQMQMSITQIVTIFNLSEGVVLNIKNKNL